MRSSTPQGPSQRRSLVEGLKTDNQQQRGREENFVYQGTLKPASTAEVQMTAAERTGARKQVARPVTRVPLTSRIRSDLAAALKRASLERQLEGAFPNTVQDMLEGALEAWLGEHGYFA